VARHKDNSTKKRKCLGPNCGREFNSHSPGHRICPICAKKAQFNRQGNVNTIEKNCRVPRGSTINQAAARERGEQYDA
jgi:hypothetical protein